VKKTIGWMSIAAVLGLVVVGCAKKEGQPANPAPAGTAKPATSEKASTAPPKEQTAQQAGQEANQVQAAVAQAAGEQTLCPVLKEPINKAIFVEYKGKKVYFCCEPCKATFEKDPEKYVKDLPQFKP
jgi:YHS domain-containing protein